MREPTSRPIRTLKMNPFVGGYDPYRPEISSTFIAIRPDFCSFHLEISNCDATRARVVSQLLISR